MDHIEAELRWLSLRLRVVVERDRRRRALGPPMEYRGLYVADEEVDGFLTGSDGATDVPLPIRDAAVLRAEIESRLAASESDDLALCRLASAFGLSLAERELVVIGLAPHVDRNYEKVFAYANDDITRKRPTVGLALAILADEPKAALRLRALFSPDAPVRRNLLLSVVDEQGNGGSPLVCRPVELDVHIAEMLLGSDEIDPRISGAARALTPSAPPADGSDGRLERVLRGRPDTRMYLGGRWSHERNAIVASGCRAAGYGVLQADVIELLRKGSAAELAPVLLREARLRRAALYLAGWGDDGSSDDGLRDFAAELRSALPHHQLPVIFSGRDGACNNAPVALHLSIEVAEPTYSARQSTWAEALQRVAADGVDTQHLASTVRLGAREIADAAEMARGMADWAGAGAVSLDDLQAAARLQSQARLSALARKIVPRFGWDDIVLPADRLLQLREIASQVLYRHVVYDEWDLGSIASLGRGVTALFAGQSGTGKTMAAEIIARDLGLDLYKIDLSGLVSKYIGETEKNLARIFDEAGESNAILFFDEADAVFGKRTEVRDSHDRYANIEVSYLLQKMDEYDGIVVLATNLRTNIDDAFLRRMRAIVEFPFPEWQDRLHIWQRMLRASVPVDGSVDLDQMARQFRITGGNIKNIVLLAAFLAAEAGVPIGMRHLLHAARREYQKLGRLVSEADFEEARP